MLIRVHPWLLVLLCSAGVFAQSPALNRTQPLALTPGRTNTFSLIGEHLGSDGTLWTSFPTQTAAAESSTSTQTFRVALSANAPLGIGALQLADSNGVSNLQLVLIDSLPGIAATGTNLDIASAQPLLPPIAVDGQCNELESQFYRIQLRRKQRVVLETIANRIGSAFDPFLRVLDATGHELANADDTPGCDADARIEFIAPASGAYLIEVRDTRYGGGTKYFYRLRVGEFAAESWHFLPLAAPQLRPIANPIPLHIATASQVTTNPASKGSRRRRTQTADTGSRRLPTSAVAELVQPPVLIQGRFDFPGDRDAFEFTPRKDERWIIHGRTRSLGAPCDLYLRLEKTDGSLIAEADATGADEGSMTNRFTEAGSVRLVVEELNHAGGPSFDYQIEITPYEPGFALSVGTNSVKALPGGTFELKVSATRRDFDGPITLSVAGLSEGFSITNGIIAEKQTTDKITVAVPTALNPGQLMHFEVIGSAEANRFQSRASTLASLKGEFPQMLYPPRELDGLISLGVKADTVAPK